MLVVEEKEGMLHYRSDDNKYLMDTDGRKCIEAYTPKEMPVSYTETNITIQID